VPLGKPTRWRRSCPTPATDVMMPQRCAFLRIHETAEVFCGAPRKNLVHPPYVCYPVCMQHGLPTRSFQLHVSTHEFFRLLSYTASYF